MALNPSIFREYDIRGVYPSTLAETDARLIGRAFGSLVYGGRGGGKICVGYDGRLSSPALKAALTEGLAEAGHQVLDTGIGPTPQLYYAAVTTGAEAGIMVTGSHNPPDHNGFKFMLGKKPFFGEDIQKLGALARSKGLSAIAGGSIDNLSIFEGYVKALEEAFQSGRQLTIAWDAGNGATGNVVAALCKRLPGKHIVLNETIDGTFPVHHPDPSVAENLEQVTGEVKRHKCDAGIAFDGDGDRIGVVDDEGEIIWGDQLLSFFAGSVLAGHPGAIIIGDIKASQTVFDEITRLGGRPLMWKSGHSHIKAKMQETGAMLAGEMSGHMFFADRWFGFDDAIYAAVRLLSQLAQGNEPLSQWRRRLPRVVNTPELRIPCDEARKFAVITEVKARLRSSRSGSEAVAQIIDIDGVRVQTPEGWWLLRASNTQGVLVARAEARNKAGLAALKAELQEQLEISGITLDN